MSAAGWLRGVPEAPRCALAIVMLVLASGGCGAASEAAEYPGLLPWEVAVGTPPASTPELLQRGRLVYGVRCATCHGADGDGDGPASLYLVDPAPRDFTQGLFKFRTTEHRMPLDEDLYRSVTAGFPAYGMPSFAYLPPEDRWAVVHFVKTFYPEWDRWTRFAAPEPVAIGAETPARPDDLERGRFLYTEHFKCINCHGPAGHGDGSLAAGLVDGWGRSIQPRDYTLGPAYRKAGWRRADTVRTAYLGIAGTPMFPHGSLLEDPGDLTDLWVVARYVERMIAESRARE